MEEQLPIVIEQNFPIALEWGTRLVVAISILVAGWMLGNFLSQQIRRIPRLDDTLTSFLGGLAKYTVFAVSLVIVLQQLGVQTASLLAVLGAAGLAIGLALQGTLSNVASGVMLLLLRPFNVGDVISFGGTTGTVKSLSLFGTELATLDNIYIFCPNSQIWNKEIQNLSRNVQRRQDHIIGISYNDDIGKAMKTIEKVLDKEERIIRTEGKEPLIAVNGLGDFSVNLLVRVWCKSSDNFSMKVDLTKAIKEALDKDGISIPFPTRTIVQDNSSEKSEPKKATTTKKKAA